MRLGHTANERGEYEAAFHFFTASEAREPRPSARLSAANMALKLGDASGALDTYLGELQDGSLPPDEKQRALLLRKIKEASTAARGPPPARRRVSRSSKQSKPAVVL